MAKLMQTKQLIDCGLSFSERKTEKVKFLTQSPTKIFCINVCNVGDCLSSSLTFRLFLTLYPLATWLLIK